MTVLMNELERDIIREILNIGLARAADSFAVIAQERVMLEVPNLDLVPSQDIIGRVRDYQARYVAFRGSTSSVCRASAYGCR
jgi:chemotaxis protein CheC